MELEANSGDYKNLNFFRFEIRDTAAIFICSSIDFILIIYAY